MQSMKTAHTSAHMHTKIFNVLKCCRINESRPDPWVTSEFLIFSLFLLTLLWAFGRRQLRVTGGFCFLAFPFLCMGDMKVPNDLAQVWRDPLAVVRLAEAKGKWFLFFLPSLETLPACCTAHFGAAVCYGREKHRIGPRVTLCSRRTVMNYALTCRAIEKASKS